MLGSPYLSGYHLKPGGCAPVVGGQHSTNPAVCPAYTCSTPLQCLHMYVHVVQITCTSGEF